MHHKPLLSRRSPGFRTNEATMHRYDNHHRFEPLRDRQWSEWEERPAFAKGTACQKLREKQRASGARSEFQMGGEHMSQFQSSGLGDTFNAPDL
jgi:hypothetical protein